MLYVFCLYLVCTVHCSLYIVQWSPFYKDHIKRGHLAMQQTKLTQDHFLLKRGHPSYNTQDALVLCRRGGVIRRGLLCVHVRVRA